MRVPSNVLDESILENLAIAVAAEAANIVAVTVTAVQANGNVPTAMPKLAAYVSDASNGSDVAVTAPDTVAIASGGAGTLTEHVSNRVFSITIGDNGQTDIEFGENGTDTWYLNIIKPDGTFLSSDAIAFT